jgi:hypothetical protein
MPLECLSAANSTQLSFPKLTIHFGIYLTCKRSFQLNSIYRYLLTLGLSHWLATTTSLLLYQVMLPLSLYIVSIQVRIKYLDISGLERNETMLLPLIKLVIPVNTPIMFKLQQASKFKSRMLATFTPKPLEPLHSYLWMPESLNLYTINRPSTNAIESLLIPNILTPFKTVQSNFWMI